MELYERPSLRFLGSVRELTLNPPGKTGVTHDGSQFIQNFSCVESPDNCGGGPAPK